MKDAKKRTKRPAGASSAKADRSLGWLEQLYFTQGAEAAKAEFERDFSAVSESSYRLLRLGEGQAVRRTDAEAKDGISYDSYSPPAFWELPYQVLRLRMEKVTQDEFLFHSGEEILVPLSGAIRYHFFWCDPSRGQTSLGRDELEPLKPGSIIRINPELPHHAWASVKEGATAWMITRPMSNTKTSIYLNTQLEAAELHPTPRRIKEDDLKKPGQYALRAWGIADRIKLQRFRSNLRIAQVAAHCGIDASHLSRIENYETNVSLDALLRIGTFLGIDLDRLMAPPPWGYDVASFSLREHDEASPYTAPLSGAFSPQNSPQPSHFLHPIYWKIGAGRQLDKLKLKDAKFNHPASWIMLSGRVIMDVRRGDDSIAELVEKDSVLHLRDSPPKKLQALEDSELLQIVYSGECFCR
jgi:transcriptional regulator with XRE-family HTH domain